MLYPSYSQQLLSLWTWALLISNHVCLVSSRLSQDASTIPILPTVTVRGFLNFKTTVDGTVIVFTPASDAQATKPTDPPQFSTNAILHSNALDSSDGVENIQDLVYSQPAGIDIIKPPRSDLDHQAHRAKESFQHISDNAVLPSTVQTNNDLETDVKKDIPPLRQYPTGLVTVLGGTHIEKGSTTIFETKVIGTYIDGKYAQILQSTSKIIAPTSIVSPQKEAVMTSLNKESGVKTSILSTPHTTTSKEVLPSPSPSATYQSPTTSSNIESRTMTSSVVQITSSRLETSKLNPLLHTSSFKEEKEFSVTKNVEQVTTPSKTMIQSSFKTPEFTPSYKQLRPTQSLESAKTGTFSKTSRFQPVSTIKRTTFEDDNTLVSPRNSRTSSTRIRFTAPRRPSQTVRLNRFKVKLTVRQDSTDDFELTTVPDEEQSEEDTTKETEEDNSQEVTPVDVDPAQVVFQETTITSEVTLHVGRRKSVRTLTITTSVPVKVDPSNSELLLHMTDSHNFHITEGDVGDDENPDPSVVTRTFTTTERTLKTSLLPIFDGHVTSYHTVTESFFIMKIITAYRTLPPGDVTVLEDLDESVVDITPTLDVAANIQSSVVAPAPPQKEQKQAKVQTSTEQETKIHSSISLPTEATPGNISPHLSNPLLSLGAALSNNPLAAVYLGLQQLNAQMTLYSTVTEVSTFVTTDTIYNTKTIRFYDGRSTRFRTVSEPLSTKKRTVTTVMTSVQPYINTQALQQQQQLQKLIAATQLSPPRPQMSTITSVYTTVTTATSLSTRIYTLIYNGFSTKFRTVTSSTLYPTTVTVTSTKEVPLSPTQPPSVPFAYPYPA